MHMRHLKGAVKMHCPHSLCFLMEYSKILFLGYVVPVQFLRRLTIVGTKGN